MDCPEAFLVVSQHIAEAASAGTYVAGRRWPKFSEEWYWEQLLNRKPFRSVYAKPGSAAQPLISLQNISQTPREECELEGYVREGMERAGPGQVQPAAGDGA